MDRLYRFGMDIGTNSIGWAVVGRNGDRRPDRILDLGTSVFPDGRDPQSGTSLAIDRRVARGMR